MNKIDILNQLTEEYKTRIRQEGDFTLQEFKRAFRDKTGSQVGDKRARKILDQEVANGRLLFFTVIDCGRDIQVWRLKEVANDNHGKQTRTSQHRPKARRAS